MIIRRGLTTDTQALWTIEQQCFSDGDCRLSRRQLRYHLGHNPLCLADCDQAFLGYILLLNYPKRLRIYSIAVLAEFRGLGIARQLLQAGEKQARDQNKQLISLEVRSTNEPALQLYHRTGFLFKQRLPSYYPDGGTAIRMEKTLS